MLSSGGINCGGIMTKVTDNSSNRLLHRYLVGIWALLVPFLMVTTVNCYGRITGQSANETKPTQLELGLQIAPGINITEVNYQVTKPGMDPIVGTFPVSNDISAAVTGIIAGLPVGTGYTITLTASTDDITCAGSAIFDIVAGVTTQINMPIQCRANKPANPICGNGLIESPEECDDGNTFNGDGCSSSCTIETALPRCGDGILDVGEECDLGSQNGVVGSGCTIDCKIAAVCGNGVVEDGETCDKGIPAGRPGACPATCDDGVPCTKDIMTGSAAICNVVCSHETIKQCADSDGCCPADCNILTDSDCPATCGDGVVTTPPETCDKAILAGQPGACPITCDDGDACTKDTMTGSADSCNVVCNHQAITQCAGGDGCCPKGCTVANDSDCATRCGDGVISTGETCDPPNTCPTSCDDNNKCTIDSMTGSADKCNVACNHKSITQCQNSDGCCPTGCNNNNDSDCSPVCGNGVIEAGEQCDDGNRISGDGCSANCTTEKICDAPANRCAQCECHECGCLVNTCYNGPGVASSGPAAGTPKSKLCADLVQCVQQSKCIGAQCLCGTASFCRCMHGEGNGPCKAQVIAAAETDDPFAISLREFCPFYAIGRAVGVTTCSFWECHNTCW